MGICSNLRLFVGHLHTTTATCVISSSFQRLLNAVGSRYSCFAFHCCGRSTSLSRSLYHQLHTPGAFDFRRVSSSGVRTSVTLGSTRLPSHSLVCNEYPSLDPTAVISTRQCPIQLGSSKHVLPSTPAGPVVLVQ